MEDCLFCKIIGGEIPSKKVYEDNICYAFWDIHPAAPVHILVVSKKHIASANDLTPEDGTIVGHMFLTIAKIARQEGIADSGYRIINNCGKDGGQTIGHLHLHLLGGRDLGEKLV